MNPQSKQDRVTGPAMEATIGPDIGSAHNNGIKPAAMNRSDETFKPRRVTASVTPGAIAVVGPYEEEHHEEKTVDEEVSSSFLTHQLPGAFAMSNESMPMKSQRYRRGMNAAQSQSRVEDIEPTIASSSVTTASRPGAVAMSNDRLPTKSPYGASPRTRVGMGSSRATLAEQVPLPLTEQDGMMAAKLPGVVATSNEYLPSKSSSTGGPPRTLSSLSSTNVSPAVLTDVDSSSSNNSPTSVMEVAQSPGAAAASAASNDSNGTKSSMYISPRTVRSRVTSLPLETFVPVSPGAAAANNEQLPTKSGPLSSKASVSNLCQSPTKRASTTAPGLDDMESSLIAKGARGVSLRRAMVPGAVNEGSSEPSGKAGRQSIDQASSCQLTNNNHLDDKEENAIVVASMPGAVRHVTSSIKSNGTDEEYYLDNDKEKKFGSLTKAPSTMEVTATAVTVDDLENQVKEKLFAEAVAAEVIGTEQDMSKGDQTKCKFKFLWMVGCLLLIVGAVVAGVVSSKTKSSSSSSVNNNNNNNNNDAVHANATTLSYAPGESPGQMALCDFLVSKSDDHGMSLMEHQSPQYRAFLWLLEDLPEAEQVYPVGAQQQKKVLTRFAMATFYLSLAGLEWNSTDNWMSKAHICSWYPGTSSQCDANQNVVELSLSNNGLRGNVPPEIRYLDHLTTLDLSDNHINGSLPFSWASWGDALTSLDLSQNDLSGMIPGEWGGLVGLATLRLDENRLTGMLPDTAFVQMKALREIHVERNSLTGSVSANVCRVIRNDTAVLYADCQEMQWYEQNMMLPILLFLILLSFHFNFFLFCLCQM